MTIPRKIFSIVLGNQIGPTRVLSSTQFDSHNTIFFSWSIKWIIQLANQIILSSFFYFGCYNKTILPQLCIFGGYNNGRGGLLFMFMWRVVLLCFWCSPFSRLFYYVSVTNSHNVYVCVAKEQGQEQYSWVMSHNRWASYIIMLR